MRRSMIMLLTAALFFGCKGKQEAAPEPEEAETEQEADDDDDDDDEAVTSKPKRRRADEPEPGAAMAAKTELLKKALKNRKRGKTLGKMVAWRKLAAFLPARFGDYKATGPARGKNFKMGKLETSSAKRYYRAGKKDLTVELNDLSVNTMLRASLRVAQKMKMKTPVGYTEQGLRVGTLPGNRAWGWDEEKKKGFGQLTLLVGGRYLARLKLVWAANEDEVIQVFKSLDLSKLPALKAGP